MAAGSLSLEAKPGNEDAKSEPLTIKMSGNVAQLTSSKLSQDSPATPLTTPAANLKRPLLTPPSSDEKTKPSRKKGRFSENIDHEFITNQEQQALLQVCESSINEAITSLASAGEPRYTWSDIATSQVAMILASPEVKERAKFWSWSAPSATSFINTYQIPISAFVQGLWCDERDTERALAANKAAWVGDAILRLQTIKRLNKLAGYTSAQEQEFLNTLSGRNLHCEFLHRNYQTRGSRIATSEQKHQLSSQIEHAILFAGRPKLVRIPLPCRLNSPITGNITSFGIANRRVAPIL